MFARHLVLLPAIALIGCSETAYLQYQDRPAETALECKAAYEEAQRRGSGMDFSSGAAMIGSAIGRGLAEGAINAAYENCLARVSALPASSVGTLPASTAPLPTPISTLPGGGCIKGGGPMQGGSGYC